MRETYWVATALNLWEHLLVCDALITKLFENLHESDVLLYQFFGDSKVATCDVHISELLVGCGGLQVVNQAVHTTA